MKNCLYEQVLLTCQQANTGEAVILRVTEENNGHLVTIGDGHIGVQLVKWFYSNGRNWALRWAIQEGPLDPIVQKVLADNK